MLVQSFFQRFNCILMLLFIKSNVSESLVNSILVHDVLLVLDKFLKIFFRLYVSIFGLKIQILTHVMKIIISLPNKMLN